MERRTLLFSVGIAILGIAIVVGVVLFLRARAAPGSEIPITTGQTVPRAPTAPAKKGTNTFTPYDQVPQAPPWKPGDPTPESIAPTFEQPSFTQPSTTSTT